MGIYEYYLAKVKFLDTIPCECCQHSTIPDFFYKFADYDAPITECGNYTEKYFSTILKIAEYDPISNLIEHPERPEFVGAVKYPDVVITEEMSFEEMISNGVSNQ